MESTVKFNAIIQARMGSTRFPRKVMQPIAGVPMIEFLLSRLSQSKEISKIILATSNAPENEPLSTHVRQLGYCVFEGSELDVLDRFYNAAMTHPADAVVRITGDCPLIDPALVDATCQLYQTANVDYTSNIRPRTFPDGLDTEVFSMAALARAQQEAKSQSQREHVTPYIRETGLFTTAGLTHNENLAAERWTVDAPEDFTVLRNIVDYFKPRTNFGWLEILALKKSRPHLFAPNAHLAQY